jgi:hypothetical protein
MDIKKIEERYAKMSDSELERILLTDAKGLREDVFEIIQKEVSKRNLSQSIISGALAQNKTYTVQEITNYATYLRSLPCPTCGNKLNNLNGTTTHYVKSFIFFTNYSAEVSIACPDCLDKKITQAIWSSLLLGWWGFPWGLIRTPMSVYRNFKSRSHHRGGNLNDTMIAFTAANIGTIEAYKDNPERLRALIRQKE